MAKGLILLGIGLILIGTIWYFFGDKLQWIGNLPGDIRIKRPNFSFYFPITTMILFSSILNVILWIIKRFFNQ